MRIDGILRTPGLVEQIARRLEAAEAAEPVRSNLSADALRRAADDVQNGRESTLSQEQEAIVRREGRPAFFVREGRIDVPSGDYWKPLIETAQARLEAAIPAVGRIDLERHPQWDWAATAWLVSEDVAITNRHVAQMFAASEPDGRIAFTLDPKDQPVAVTMDFRHEHQVRSTSVCDVYRVLHIEPARVGRPDLAVLQLAPAAGTPLPKPIKLAATDPSPRALIGAVGYPDKDLREGQAIVEQQLFGGVYGVKRFLPGEVMSTDRPYMNHDCSTLVGSSGSVLLDFERGEAVGLHYAGEFEQANFAVKASKLLEVLHRLQVL